MSHTDCPHCGARNFSFLASTELTRCRDCGRALAAESEIADLRDLVADTHRRMGRFRGLESRGRSAT